MKINKIVFLAGILLSSAQVIAVSKQDASFSKDQRKEIQSIVHDYLLTNPEVLIEASRSLQEKQQKEMLARVQSEIPKYTESLFKSKTSPVRGNPKGKVYIVEFLDYACGHCRKMHKIVNKLLEKDKSIKVIYKEFPIFSGPSDYAARMALAASKYGKYERFHSELFAVEPPLNEEKIDSIAKKLKLDLTKLKKTAQSDEVTTEMKETLELARNIGIMGTPAFIVAKDIHKTDYSSFYVPGSLTFDELSELLKKVNK